MIARLYSSLEGRIGGAVKEPLKVQDRNGSIFWLEEFTAGTTIVWQPQLGRGPRVSLAYAQLYATAKKLNLSEPVLERAAHRRSANVADTRAAANRSRAPAQPPPLEDRSPPAWTTKTLGWPYCSS